jgi:putative holliday junction resolvase
MRVLALDYGAARTGVAVCDETGTIARPLTVVEKVDSEAGMADLVALVEGTAPDLVVVGLPVPLSGGVNAQTRRVDSFVARLRTRLVTPVETFDERFTTTIAQERGGRAPLDARAAALLLEEYLRTRGVA